MSEKFNHYAVERIEELYDPDGGDIAAGPDGRLVRVTWAEFELLQMVKAQQRQIEALEAQVTHLEATRLVEDVPYRRDPLAHY